MTTTRIETVASVKSRQVIWVDWMQKATAGLTDDSLVEVTTQHTPFGDYCLGIKPAIKQTAMERLRERRRQAKSDAMVMRHAQAGNTSVRRSA